jgi:hypothetical protein
MYCLLLFCAISQIKISISFWLMQFKKVRVIRLGFLAKSANIITLIFINVCLFCVVIYIFFYHIIITDTEKNKKVFYIFIDQTLAKCVEGSLVNALEELFGFYYVLNIAYPKTASLTCEFMQRLFLKIRSTYIRGAKTSAHSINSVLSLICDISDI